MRLHHDEGSAVIQNDHFSLTVFQGGRCVINGVLILLLFKSYKIDKERIVNRSLTLTMTFTYRFSDEMHDMSLT